jgi:hypothetical protein
MVNVYGWLHALRVQNIMKRIKLLDKAFSLC